MTSIKRPLLLILLLCIAVPAFAVDTVRTYDTVVHYDTTYLYDTTIAIQKQLTEMKSEFYDRAMQSIDDKRSSVNIMLVIIVIFLAIMTIVFGFMTYLMQRSRQAVDNEIKEIRERRLAIDKVYDEMKSKEERFNKLMSDVDKRAEKPVAAAEKEAREIHERRFAVDTVYDEIVSRDKRINKLMSEIEERAEKPVAVAEKEAQERSITLPDEKIKLINEVDAEESIDEYEKLLFAMEVEGVSKDKLPTSLHKNVGLNYFALDRYPKAVEEFLLYLKAFPRDAEILSSLAYCHYKLKDYDKARIFYGRAADADPTNDILYSNWGGVLINLYNDRKEISILEEVIDKCNKAIEINNKNDNAYVNWGTALNKLYDERKDVSLLEEAIAKYNKAIEINDKNALAHYNLAEVLLKKWRHKLEDTGKSDQTLLKDARAMALKAVELAPEDKDNYYNVACVESVLENKTEMLKTLKIAIEYDTKFKKMAREDKDFEKHWDDPDFIALTKED